MTGRWRAAAAIALVLSIGSATLAVALQPHLARDALCWHDHAWNACTGPGGVRP
jgi:hypothetical protein